MSAYDNWLTNAPDDSDDLIDSLLHDFRKDPTKVAEADENWGGTVDLTDAESALADLHSIEPSDLLGRDVLTRLYRMAKVCFEAREAELLDMARDEAAKQRRDSEDMRAECAAMSRWVA